MTGGKKASGYTIVEVLIFMAVSSLMFLLAANFINGKQSAAEFKQGMTDAESRITGVLNDVANGNYPSSVDFKCSIESPSSATSAPKITKLEINKQGANKGCVFFGKVIQFGLSPNNTGYRVYSVTARQSNTAGAPIQSFLSALPIAIDGSSYPVGGSAYFHISAAGVNLTERGTLQYGLEIKKAFLCSGDCSAGTGTGMIGFFGSMGNYGVSTNADPQSGAQSVIAAVVPNSSLGMDQPNGAQHINSEARFIKPNHTLGNGKYVLLCFLNGTKNGSITIGGSNSRQLTTQMELGAGVPQKCKD